MWRTPWFCCLAWLLAFACCQPVAAQALGEPDLKAQIVFRVLLFVQWPPDRLPAAQPMELCLQEDDGFAQALGRLSGQQVQGHRLRVRKTAGEPLTGCHVVYVGARVPPLPHPGVLLVGDRLGLVEQGAMLNLQVDSGRVAFDVGLASARRAGLEVSAKLLRLARFVKDD